MSEYIPLDVQAEILKWLPLKPLIQFRSVSKPWKSLIDSPEFTAAYGVRQTHPSRLILRYTLFIDIFRCEERFLTFVDNDGDSFVQQDFVPTIPDLVKRLKPPFSTVLGSSHGLLCFHGFMWLPDYFDDAHSSNGHGNYMVVLWNPSIRKSVAIQVPNGNLCCNGDDNVFGFGVCPVTFDPTILKIKCIDNYEQKMKDMPGISIPWEVRVFTLSTGTWSIISTNLPRESIRLSGSQVDIDRFIYWVAFDTLDAGYGGSQSRSLIMSFDLTAKEFKEINLTGSLANRFCWIETISKLRESLVLLADHREFLGGVSVCCLWMMKEQGVSRSFTKLYTINLPNSYINQILGFRKTGELILEIQQYKQNAKLQIYEPNSEAIDNLGVDGTDWSFLMCSYMETLLLLDQLDGFIYWISN